MDVIELRQRILTEMVNNLALYHTEDAKRVRESDYWVKRFILHKNQGPNSAFYHMKDTFKWKRSFGVRDFDPCHIPKEIYELGGMFSYQPDRKGCIPIFIRIKYLIKPDDNVLDLDNKMKQYFAYLMDKVDNDVRKPRSWSIIFDFQEAGIENANFDLMFFALDIVGKHFPMQPKYVLATCISSWMKPFVSMGTGMLPEEARDLLHIVDKEDLEQWFDKETLPDFLGGKGTDYIKIPEGAKSMYELGKELYNLSEAEVKTMMEPWLVVKDDGGIAKDENGLLEFD